MNDCRVPWIKTDHSSEEGHELWRNGILDKDMVKTPNCFQDGAGIKDIICHNTFG